MNATLETKARELLADAIAHNDAGGAARIRAGTGIDRVDFDSAIDAIKSALSQPVGAGEGFVVVPRVLAERAIRYMEPDDLVVGPAMRADLAADLRATLAAPTPPAAEDARDAKRYRWLRDVSWREGPSGTLPELWGRSRPTSSARGIDAAIDAAMSGDGEVGK